MSDASWQGERPTLLQASATFYAGVSALMIGGIQPLVFGAFVAAGRIELADLGRIATLESLGMAAGASAGAGLLRRIGTRRLGVAASLAILVSSLAMARADTAAALYGLRAGAGFAEGALLSLTIALIARAPAPERWSGTFLGIQTLTQSAGAWAVPAVLAPRLGANAGAALLAAMAAIACATSPLGAQEPPLAPRSEAQHGGRVPTAAWIGLAFVGMALASNNAIWSYFERLGNARGLAPAVIGTAAAACLVSQAIGSFAATLVGPRLGWLAAAGVATLALLSAAGALHASTGAPAFALAGVGFGFFWLFGMPYQVRGLVELDPSRASARLIASAQILGGSVGPLAASWLVRGGDLGGVLRFSAAATLAAFALAVSAAVWKRREQRRA